MAESFTTVRKQSLTEEIHDRILELIIRNPSNNEDVLLNEKNLTELFGVSKAPVREALIKLCGEGVLRNVPRLGYLVIRLSEQDVQDLMSMRCSIEIECLRQTAPRINPALLAALREQIKRAKAKQNVDVWEVWNDNQEFHMMLVNESGSRIRLKYLEEIMAMQKLAYAQQHWRTMNDLVDSVDVSHHLAIFESLEKGDTENAVMQLRKDICWKF